MILCPLTIHGTILQNLSDFSLSQDIRFSLCSLRPLW